MSQPGWEEYFFRKAKLMKSVALFAAIAIAVLAVAVPTVADATNCTTTCYGSGNYRTCNTYCY